MLAHYHEFSDLLLPPSGRQPRVVYLSPRQAWQLRLDDGLVLELGRDQGRPHSSAIVWNALPTTYAPVKSRVKERVWGFLIRPPIDMRYPNGFAVRTGTDNTEFKQGQYMSKETRELIVGLDIGTSKIVAIVAELLEDGRLSVLGIGSQESIGLKKGVVVNIEATVNAISRAIQEVELMTNVKVKDVYTGIAGSHIKSKDSNGMAVVKDKEVTQYDVERAIEAANATPISADDQSCCIRWCRSSSSTARMG